jgi:hypothetical protein
MIDSKLWGVFHDGEIVSVSGSVPGDLDVYIKLEYIREQFLEAGNAFRIHITACDMLCFKSFSTNEVLHGVVAVAAQDLEILRSKLDADVLEVVTTSGLLRIRYGSEALFLDSGRALPFSDVAAAANRAVSELKQPDLEAKLRHE